MIDFYYNPMSRARTVHWMLEEVGAPYNVHLVDFKKSEQKAPAFLALNSMGKIPTIVHKGVVVTEGAAICAYLADAFPEKKLAPALDDPQRGTYFRWMFFAVSCVESAILDKSFPRDKEAPSMSIGYGTFEDTMNALEKAVSTGGFLTGSNFTAADLYVASTIGWGMMTKVVPARPAFVDYLKRCGDRPSYQRFEKQTAEWMARMT